MGLSQATGGGRCEADDMSKGKGAKDTQVGLDSLRDGSTISTVVEAYYDDWAVNYNENLRSWNYRTPEEAAAQLAPFLPAGARILDVGCGTGMFGEALLARIACVVTGVDISNASLELAERCGVYARLQRYDLQDTPFPFLEDGFDAAASVGVMTYIASPGVYLTELCRIVRPGGHILFTHRDDRWQEDCFDGLIQNIEEQGLWTILDVSEAKPYMPGNEDFADNIKVIFILCRVK